MDKSLNEYRSLLVTADQKAQEDYDKTVLALSGGALGISFAFITDIVGSRRLMYPRLLLVSWILWGVSTTCVLASFYFSQQAVRMAIAQVDSDQIYDQTPGRWCTRVTAVLNALGGLLFLTGVILMGVFVSCNLR